MNTTDFTSMPVIGPLMKATGLSDGWMLISIVLAILLIVFLIAWICTARKSRARAKQIAHMQEEIVGLQAISNLPPLHSSAFGNPGDSIVFASTRELKKRRDAIANIVAPETGSQESSEQATAEFSAPEIPPLAQEGDAPKDPFAPRTTDSDKSHESVTAQVHDAIFASVSNMHKDIKNNRVEKPEPEHGKAENRTLKSSDVPTISKPTEAHDDTDNADALARLEAKLKKRSESEKAMPSQTSANLSGRIPKL